MRLPVDKAGDNASKRPKRMDRPLEHDVSDVLSRAIKGLVAEETNRRLEVEYRAFAKKTAEIDSFCALLTSAASFDATAAVGRLWKMRLTRHEIVHFFERASIALGLMWETDKNDFFDVTVGMARLHTILRCCIAEHAIQNLDETQQAEVLIATLPGEEHTFAASLLELNMRLLGWNTTLFYAKTHKELSAEVATNNYDVICLSWTTMALTDSLSQLNKTIAAFEPDNRPIVVAGGAASEEKGKWLVRIGVDHIRENALGAIDVVREVISNRTKSDAIAARTLSRAAAQDGQA